MSLAAAIPEASPGSSREMWLITLGHSLTHWYPATFYLLLPKPTSATQPSSIR